MTTFPRTAPTPPFQPLRQLARRMSLPRITVRPTRARRHRTLAHPPPAHLDLWDIDHTELRTALDESWH
jgi:hypothetical protein